MENRRNNFNFNNRVEGNPFSSITSVLFLVLAFVALYFIATGIFKILAWLAPVMLIATLIIDYKVVVNYGKWIVSLLSRNPLMGIGAILLTFFGFPIVAGFLLGKALVKKKVGKMTQEFQKRQEGEYTDFEEVDSRPSVLDLPSMEPRHDYNEYEDLLDDDTV